MLIGVLMMLIVTIQPNSEQKKGTIDAIITTHDEKAATMESMVLVSAHRQRQIASVR